MGADRCGVCGASIGSGQESSIAGPTTSSAGSGTVKPPNQRLVVAYTMIVAAFVLAVVGLVAWDNETEKVDLQNGIDSLLAGSRGDIFYENQAPNRTGP